jgi:hypothetical protein
MNTKQVLRVFYKVISDQGSRFDVHTNLNCRSGVIVVAKNSRPDIMSSPTYIASTISLSSLAFQPDRKLLAAGFAE